MAGKRDEVTIREVYELLDRLRRESDERDRSRAEEAKLAMSLFENKISDLYVEIYGEGETRGLKSRISANELDIISISSARKTDAWKQFIMTIITGLTAWAAATFTVHK